MQTTKIAAALGLGFLMLTMIVALPPRAAHAQCNPATGADCDPGDKKKKPTPTDVPAATPTLILVPRSGGSPGLPLAPVTPTATIDPSLLATARACWDGIYRQTPAPELPTASWGDIQGDAPQCIPTFTPTKVPPISLTHVAGPVFVAPGVKNVIIAVLVLGVVLAAVSLITRRLKPPNPNKPPSPNK